MHGFYVVEKGEDRIESAQSRQQAALVGVQQGLRPGCLEEAGRYYPLKDLRHRADWDYYPEGGWRLIAGFGWLVERYPIRPFQRGQVVSQADKRGKDLDTDRGIDPVDLRRGGVGDPLGPRAEVGEHLERALANSSFVSGGALIPGLCLGGENGYF